MHFESLIQQMRDGEVGVSDALDQLTQLLQQCGAACDPPPITTATARSQRTQPWFDAECQRLSSAFDTAWQAWHASRGGAYRGEGDLSLHASMLEARRAYKRVVRRKKFQHAQQCQLQLLQLYFGDELVLWPGYWSVPSQEEQCSSAESL
jgi:hypothetical protein